MLRPGTFALTLLLAMLTALGPLSMDMYLPSLPDIAHVLQAPTARVQLTISSYLIGFAVGQMIYGPLSDSHGRRPVLLVALVLYLASTLGCAASQSIDLLIAARFLQGIGGSGSIVLSRAIVRDLYSGVRAARELSLMSSIAVCTNRRADDRRRVSDRFWLALEFLVYHCCRNRRPSRRGAAVAGDGAQALRRTYFAVRAGSRIWRRAAASRAFLFISASSR